MSPHYHFAIARETYHELLSSKSTQCCDPTVIRENRRNTERGPVPAGSRIFGRLRWGKNHRLPRAEGKGARTGRGPGRGGGAAADSVENARRLGGANPAWNDSRELSDSRRGGPQRAAFGHDVVRRRRGRVEPGEHCARKRRSAAGQRRRTGEAGRNRKCRPRGRQVG